MEEKVSKFNARNAQSSKSSKRNIKNVTTPNNEANRNLGGSLSNTEEIERRKCLFKKIIFPIIGILLIAVIIVLIVLFVKKPNNKNNIIDSQSSNNINQNEEDGKDKEINPINPSMENKIAHIETEFEFNTTIHDLKRVFVEQKYEEEIMTEGVKSNIFVDRKTNYDIYIISEEDPDEENKNFYNKKYTASISISSQCISMKNEDCIPQKMIDMTKINHRNIRSLEEIKDLKDIPVPLCLFNLTDNDVILSMTCPESLQKNIKENMILDLYFFRPPAIKRPDKQKGNITITKMIENNKQFIRETNGGICDIPDSFNSFCTTDMNTTTDLNGNIIRYDEVSFTNITRSENNYYIKNKITKLIDQTENLPKIDRVLFEEGLNKLLSKMEPYMEYKEEFSTENFKQLYKLSKNITDKDENIRSLRSEKGGPITSEEELFFFEHYGGVKIFLNLFDDIGYNTESMKAFANIKIDDFKKELSTLKEFTNIGDILDKLIILSESGNRLATALFNEIVADFGNITDIVKENITNINNLVIYKDLSELFDSTLSIDSLKILPIAIIQESSDLKNKLLNILNQIENGSMKNHINILNENIYNFIRNAHKLIDNIFKNLNSLGKSLSSSKSKLTEISTYYLNNTSTSYVTTIDKAQNLLLNYYKDEYNLILPKINSLLKEFEDSTKESIQKEEKIVDNLYTKLEKKQVSIENANSEDYRNINLDLYNSKNYISEIINKAKDKIKKEMDIKDSEYFISNYDITTNNNSFTQVIEDAKKIAIKLDNDEYIDKIFDQTMIYFRENYTYIMKYMNKIKEEKFPLDEDVLKSSFLTTKEQESMSENIGIMGVTVSEGIKDENNDYLKSLKNEVDTFLNQNKNQLDDLILNLTMLFSEESLKKLSNLYDAAFQSCLNKIKNDIETNKKLANDYFKELADIIKDNNKIIDLLKSFKTDEQNMPYILVRWNSWHYVYFKYFIDSISSKTKTQAYLIKYSTFKGMIQALSNYINKQLYIDLKYEYKNAITKLRETLQIIKNTKISDQYPDFPEVNFIDNNIKKINDLYNRLNKYLSDDIFNNKYVTQINNYKSEQIAVIQNIDNNEIEANNQIINTQETSNDYNNDFCITFLRKKTYTCTNGAIYNYENSDYYCLPLSSNSDNYKKLITLSISSDSNMNTFIDSLKDFLSKLDNNVNSYSSLINKLKNNLLSKENEIYEKQTTLNNLGIIQNKVDLILNNKYGDKIIKASYDYYQSNIEQGLTTIFEDISNKWINSFVKLKEEVTKNLNSYKNSINEFGIMALLYQKILSTNITNTYFDSINLHQQNEFNYTISYYYNYLLKIVKSAHQYIISKIPINKDGFNRIVLKRENEVNDIFEQIINSISKSKDEAMSINNQLYVLQVPITNFFKVNNLLTNTQTQLSTTLSQYANEVYNMKNKKTNDEASLSCRFYLENSENGKQIYSFYEPIDNKVFIFLNLAKFNDLILNNWIFDQDDFIKQLTSTLYNTNLETSKELETKKENYKLTLENLITKYFTIESIVEKINNLYEGAIKELTDEKIGEINQNINNILIEIKSNLLNEGIRLNTTLTSYYNDSTKINNTIEDYKENIFRKINETIFSIIEQFYLNIEHNVYKNYIEYYLNTYITNTKNITSKYTNSSLLNSSYHIGEIIDGIVEEKVNIYKITVKRQIFDKYIEYINNLANKIKINDIKNTIYNEIDNEYNSKLYPSLKIHAKYNVGDEGYTEYDLSEDIKVKINTNIKSNNDKILKIMNSTVGTNYGVDLRAWEILDYSRIYSTITGIKDSFDKFIVTQKNNEVNNVNDCIQKLIKSNFNDLLNNLIPSFGNEFFKRIITYNENFKINGLYDNLRWGLTETLSYYVSLYSFSRIKALTKDLKIKLYSLNNLDGIIEEKNSKILELLNLTINDFINDSKNHIIRQYLSYFKADTSIGLAFNADIKKKIDENLNRVINEIESDYILLLDKYLKEELISSYTKVLNEKTEEMIKKVRTQREYIKSRIDDLFSLDPDEVLNDINTKLNNTLNSIDEYNKYINNSFKISEEMKLYLNDYGKNIIKPSYEKLKIFLNRLTKDKILPNIDKNSKDYENSFNLDKFIKSVNNTFNLIKDNYIESINESIYKYGPNDYPNNLYSEVNRRRLRRLDITLNEEENINDYIQKVADKSVDETFQKLLINSDNTKRFIKTFEQFEEFDKIIQKYINDFNYAYKASKKIIEDNDYEEDTHIYLEDKLTYLKNVTSNYYFKINESFYSIKNYLDKSIVEIDDLLNKCAHITYKTFENEYFNISKKVEAIDNEQDESEDLIEMKNESISSKNQNNQYYSDIYIESFRKKAQFKFKYEFDEVNHLKMPKVYANVINLNRPKRMNFKIYNYLGRCAKNIQEIDIVFNDANYSMFLNFNASSRDINTTVISQIDDYRYTVERYTTYEEEGPICIKDDENKTTNNDDIIDICFEPGECSEEKNETLAPIYYVDVLRKNTLKNLTL